MDSHKITNLANGTDSGDAVNKSQLDAKALITGSAAQEFAVAAATTGNSAVNKTQFDAKTGLATTTTLGIVEKATQAEMNAGTADKFPSALEIFNGFHLGTADSDYMKLPDFLGGFIVQWGYNSSTSNPVTISFPIAFPTKCFSVVATTDASTSVLTEVVMIASKTTSGFEWNGARDNTSNYVFGWWIAIGY